LCHDEDKIYNIGSNSLGGFNSHLTDPRKSETSTPTRSSDVDKFVDNLDELLLSDHAGEIETTSVFDAISTRATPVLLGSDSNRSEEDTQFKSRSDLEEDLDRLLKIGDEGATTCRGHSIFDNDSDSDEEYSLTNIVPSSWSLGGQESHRLSRTNQLQSFMQIEWLVSSVTSYTDLASPTLPSRIWNSIFTRISFGSFVNAVPLSSSIFQWLTHGPTDNLSAPTA
jgi:hypothetical protein